MKKRFLFYFFQAIALAGILYLAVFIYFKDIHRAYLFILERKGNFLLVFFSILFLTNLLDVETYKKGFINKEFDIVHDIFLILGKVFVVIVVVSFLEYFVFFSTKIGRIIYIGLYFFSSVFFIAESLIISNVISKKRQKLLWASDISPDEVERHYNIRISKNGLNNNLHETNGYDIAIYDYPPRIGADISKLLHTIIAIKNPIDLITYIEDQAERIPLKYVDELWLLKNIRTYENAYDKLRRMFNVVFSFMLLLVLFTPAFMAALIHRATSYGPIFFIQERVGYKGKTFNLIKFRTMVHNAEANGPQFARENDPRITKIGKLMRIFRIDEVPQLINILKGEMGLIGPRPERKDFIAMLEKEIPFYTLRLEVRPGLTGWAQANHSYAGENIEDHMKKLEYDLYYIKNRSLPMDILILLKTIKTVLWRRGT